MNRPLSRLATRAAYGASQLPRIAWYLGHGLAMTRIAQRARESGSARPRPHTDAPIPDRKRFFADLGALWRQDLANVEAGVYPLPADHDGSLKMLLDRSRLFFEDIPAVHRRRENGDHSEVLTEESRGKRPRYYLQNFHFQSGGWMTDESAQRYDTQVEVLFNGAANATRRQALPPLREVFAGRDQRRLSLLDVGCGTGRFLDFVKQTWPRLPRAQPRCFRGLCEGGQASFTALVANRPYGGQRGIDSAAGREPGRGNEHLHVPRTAAEGAPHRSQ